jgi:hypothetical protein
VIRLIGKEPQFRIIPCVDDEAMVGPDNPVLVFEFVVLAERQGQGNDTAVRSGLN